MFVVFKLCLRYRLWENAVGLGLNQIPDLAKPLFLQIGQTRFEHFLTFIVRVSESKQLFLRQLLKIYRINIGFSAANRQVTPECVLSESGPNVFAYRLFKAAKGARKFRNWLTVTSTGFTQRTQEKYIFCYRIWYDFK